MQCRLIIKRMHRLIWVYVCRIISFSVVDSKAILLFYHFILLFCISVIGIVLYLSLCHPHLFLFMCLEEAGERGIGDGAVLRSASFILVYIVHSKNNDTCIY